MVVTTYIYVKGTYAYEVVETNKKRVEDVFENMIYSPILCRKRGANCARIEISANGNWLFMRSWNRKYNWAGNLGDWGYASIGYIFWKRGGSLYPNEIKQLTGE